MFSWRIPIVEEKIIVCRTNKPLMKPHGMSGRPPGAQFYLLLALSALLLIPCFASAATPPPLPDHVISVSDDTLSRSEDLEISAVWDRDVSLYRPPESLYLQIYSASSGSLIAGYTIPEDKHAASEENIRYFRGLIPSSELPADRLTLVVTDPVSGADARMLVNVTETGPDFPDVHMQRSADTLFALVAVFLLILLSTVLGLLIRRS